MAEMSREKAIDYLKWARPQKPYTQDKKNLQAAIDMGIEALNEQRPHGKWEFVGDNLFKCTHCGYIANADYLRDWKAHTYDEEFPTACLKCGASMLANDRQVTSKLVEKSKDPHAEYWNSIGEQKEGEKNENL